MANCFAFTLQNRLPILAGVYPSLSSTTSVSYVIVNSLPHFSKKLSRGISGYQTPRRLVLGLGVSFLGQFMSMAGNIGGKSFLASAARQKGAVEQVTFLLNYSVVFGFIGSFWFLGSVRF